MAHEEQAVKRTRLSVSVTTEDPEILTRAIETFSRAVTGLAMEGVETFTMCGPDSEEDD